MVRPCLRRSTGGPPWSTSATAAGERVNRGRSTIRRFLSSNRAFECDVDDTRGGRICTDVADHGGVSVGAASAESTAAG
jgi:hypothetical protein